MTEILVRTAGPAVVVVFEVEGPTRLISTAQPSEDSRVDDWIATSRPREVAVAAALADRWLSGGAARGRAWTAALSLRPGIVEAVERLLDER